jgi:hypothetical protein
LALKKIFWCVAHLRDAEGRASIKPDSAVDLFKAGMFQIKSFDLSWQSGIEANLLN